MWENPLGNQSLIRVVGLPNWQATVIPLRYVAVADNPPVQASAMADQAAVERFARYLAGMGRSPNTRRLYLAAVQRWLTAGGHAGHVDCALLARYLAGRRERCATATVNMDVKALRAFYRLQVACGDATSADVRRLPRLRRVPVRAPRWLSDAQVGEVLAACPLDAFVGVRDYAIVLTLYTTGLRASELASMTLGSFIDDAEIFAVGKGGHPRYVPTGAPLAGILNGYLHARSRLRPGKRSAFWLRSDGKPLRNGRSIWEIVSKRCWQALGLRSGLHQVRRVGKPWQGHYPHALRASFATALLHRGTPITAIAQLMGHRDVATTAHYLGVDLEHLRRAAACHPRAKRSREPD